MNLSSDSFRKWKAFFLLPLFALLGLLAGLSVRFIGGDPLGADRIWFATLVLGGLPIIYQTIKGMLEGKFASDIVAMMAIVTAALLHQAFAGAVVVLMQSGGEAIEAFGLRRATSSLTTLLERAPRIARRKKGEGLEEVDVSEVKVGDVLVVRPGDLIPVDGTVLSEAASIDESALTGEPLPRKKERGERLMSGSVNQGGPFEMQAERISQESQYAKIVALVKKAQEEKAPIQRLADRYAVLFTPLTLLVAALGFWITRDYRTILSVLVVATPCPLILATPLAVICGINRAADRGIIVKGGAPMEQVAQARSVVFDKTGTLTFGIPLLQKIIPFNLSEEELLFIAASIDQLSSHLVAKSFVDQGIKRSKSLVLPADFHEYPGRGVEGVIGNKRFFVGSLSFVEEKTKPLSETERKQVHREEQENQLLVFVASEQCNGFFVLTDQIRPGTAELMSRLHSLGVEEIAMVTGDSHRNGKGVAQQAGIARFHTDLFPEQKVEIVRNLEETFPPSVMVGDGINDAPALATATVGIAMGAHGTAISAEAADIILLVDDLEKVAESIEIGQRMLKIAKQSIFIGMGLSFCLMIIAAFGHIIPAVGALLQEIVDVAVILNALRAR